MEPGFVPEFFNNELLYVDNPWVSRQSLDRKSIEIINDIISPLSAYAFGRVCWLTIYYGSRVGGIPVFGSILITG